MFFTFNRVAISALCMLVFLFSIPTAKTGLAEDKQVPTHVILMIADGMGMGQIELARLFEHETESQLFIDTLPDTAFVKTSSASHHVTDSAAGGTALATGVKVANGTIGIAPDGSKLKSLLHRFKETGKTVGVVSTNAVTDATPAAFVANVANRWDRQPAVAKQLLERNVDIILGGGERFFSPEAHNGTDLRETFKQRGYKHVQTKQELAKLNGVTKVLGLFNEHHLHFVSDRKQLDLQEPSLPEMTAKAIDLAAQNPDGFFLMIEGARVDHASHASDLPGIWREMIEFDQAVKHAVNWAKKQGDTLVVVTSDHETMGISATEPIDVEALKAIDVSPELMAQQLIFDPDKQAFTTKSIKDLFAANANIALTDEQAETFKAKLERDDRQLYSDYLTAWDIGHLIANHYYGGTINRQTRKLSKTTAGHTANMVPLFSYGVGSENFNGVLDNTDVPRIIARISGLRW